jgi:hypothetical protein
VRRGSALFLLHAGLALASVALAVWLVRRTALEPNRTAEVTDAVLDSPELRAEISRQVSERISQQTGEDPSDIEPFVDEVLEQEGVGRMLAGTITAAHRRLVDPDAPPATIDTQAMSVLTGGQVPEEFTLTVPTIGWLDTARRALDQWLPFVTLVAAALALAGVALHPNQPRGLCHVGYWLVGATLVQVALGYLVPVVVAPALTASPWADVVATAVRAYSRTLITTLAAVLAAGGVALLTGAAWGLGGQRAYAA